MGKSFGLSKKAGVRHRSWPTYPKKKGIGPPSYNVNFTPKTGFFQTCFSFGKKYFMEIFNGCPMSSMLHIQEYIMKNRFCRRGVKKAGVRHRSWPTSGNTDFFCISHLVFLTVSLTQHCLPDFQYVTDYFLHYSLILKFMNLELRN
jgi:hypothetical protein